MGSLEFKCSCGFSFLNSIDNRNYVGWLIADQDSDAFWDQIDGAIEKSGPTPADKEQACMDLRASLFNARQRVWQCGKCGIIYITDADGIHYAHAPVTDTPKNLFAGRGISFHRVSRKPESS